MSTPIKKNNSNTPAAVNTKSARRNKRRRANINSERSTQTTMSWGPSELVMSKSVDTGIRKFKSANLKGITEDGIKFLKCAFAPPDFQNMSLSGVPDEYRGMSIVQKHRFVGPELFTAGQDYWFLLAPSPGIAFYVLNKAAGTDLVFGDQFVAVPYSDFNSLFGANSTANALLITKYRYASNHFEIIPTVNQTTWSGQIQAWKIPLSLVMRSVPTSAIGVPANMLSVTGLQGASLGAGEYSNQYSGPFINGIYTAAYNTNDNFAFSPVLENQAALPSIISTADFGQLINNSGIPGLDINFETTVIKVSGITANQSAIIKAWACVEYQVNAATALYGFQTMSPYDPVALELYREIVSNLPVGVPFTDNEGFWRRVLSIIYQLTNAGAFVPGPIGLASRGLNMLSQAGMSVIH